MLGLVLLEMGLVLDSVCVRFGFIRNRFSVLGLVLLEMDSVCVRFSFTRNRFSVCQV